MPTPTHTKNPSQRLFDEPSKKWVNVKEALNLPDSCNSWYVSPTGFKAKNKQIISRTVFEPIQTIVFGNQYQFTDQPVYSTKYHKFQNKYNVIRCLTNEELAILQGFRKDFKFYGNKSSIKKQISNALPAAISKAFFQYPVLKVTVK